MSQMITLDEIDDELSHEAPRRRTIIDPHFPAAPILAFASTGVGKTGLAIETATAVAGGLEWAGHSVQAGAVLYVAGENYYGVKERLLASCRFHRLQSSIPIGLIRPGVAGLISPTVKEEVADAARDLVGQTGQDLSMIVIDTLGASFGQKSQDDAQFASEFMNNVEALCEEFSCATLVLHHTGKDGKMRGSQVFEDRADTVLKLERQKDGVISVTITKQRSSPGGQRFSFKIQSYDLAIHDGEISVQVVSGLQRMATRHDEQDQPQTKESDVDVALRLLRLIANDGEASYRDWRNKLHDAWSDRTDDARRRAHATAAKKLTGDGKIQVDRESDLVRILVSKSDAHSDAHGNGEAVGVSVSATPPIRGGAHTRSAHSKTPLPDPNINRVQDRSLPKTGTEG